MPLISSASGKLSLNLLYIVLSSISDAASYKWYFYFTSAVSFLLFPSTRKWPLRGVLPLHKMHFQLNLQRRLLHIACRNTISSYLATDQNSADKHTHGTDHNSGGVGYI